VLLALYTGQRRSNVLAMKWNDIDSDGVRDEAQRIAEGRELPLFTVKHYLLSINNRFRVFLQF